MLLIIIIFFSFFAILTLSSQLSEIPCEEKKTVLFKIARE